jgi:hypothetical protein
MRTYISLERVAERLSDLAAQPGVGRHTIQYLQSLLHQHLPEGTVQPPELIPTRPSQLPPSVSYYTLKQFNERHPQLGHDEFMYHIDMEAKKEKDGTAGKAYALIAKDPTLGGRITNPSDWLSHHIIRRDGYRETVISVPAIKKALEDGTLEGMLASGGASSGVIRQILEKYEPLQPHGHRTIKDPTGRVTMDVLDTAPVGGKLAKGTIPMDAFFDFYQTDTTEGQANLKRQVTTGLWALSDYVRKQYDYFQDGPIDQHALQYVIDPATGRQHAVVALPNIQRLLAEDKHIQRIGKTIRTGLLRAVEAYTKRQEEA